MNKNVIYFWKNDHPFSNWFPSNFYDNEGIFFANNEQYMMYHKAKLFNDQDSMSKIMATNKPYEIKKLGRQVKNFDLDIWSKNAKSIVTQGCIYKFSQNPDLKEKLIDTGSQYIAEASPYNKIWGIGLSIEKALLTPKYQWNGTNWLGECLMDARNKI